MNNEELKNRVIEILDNNIRWQPYYYISRGIVYEDDLGKIADALISAGIGDVKEAGLERKACEVASNQYRIWFEEQKDRAEVAEKALDLCETAYILSLNHRATEGISGQAIASDFGIHKFFMKQAEKELAEEGKDENY